MAVGAAVGGGIMDTTSNSGQTWTGQTMPVSTPPSLALFGVACPQAGECFAAGSGTNGPDILSYSGPAVTTTSLPTATTGVLYSASLAATGGQAPYRWQVSAGSLPAGLTLNAGTGAITGAPTSVGTSSFTVTVTDSESTAATATANLSIFAKQGPGHGYWLVGGDGGIFTFGNAHFFGSTGNLQLQRPVVGMTPTADVRGYWMVAGDGGMFAFGDAKFHGSIPGLGYAPAGSGAPKSLDAPIVAMVTSPTGQGYLLVAADGGVFAFGDAKFHGSCPAIGGCNGSVVAVVPDQGELGYWVVTSTGHVYAFGNAASIVASHATAVAAPITGAAATPSGHGFLMTDALGDVYSDGDVPVMGVPPTGLGFANLIRSVVPTSTGHGYWLFGAAGAVYPYGDAPHDGSMADHQLNAPIVTAAGF
jgi:hypothetical protein